MGFFEKLKNGLAKTKAALAEGINNIFKNFRRVDEDLMDELEELLITSDVGVETTMEMLDELRDRIKTDNIKDPEEVKKVLFDIIRSMIGDSEPIKTGDAMTVILVIGVNGVGKTTSIAKIANVMKRGGKKVILCAADTFRAAAADQLRVWADRVGVDIIAQSEGSDPAAVVYDAAGAAKKRGADVLIIDTAGRLHNKKNLMNELNKIRRVIARELPDTPCEVLLVLDATTGQNAVAQAEAFLEVCELTGVILTKLDGTAKGGVTVQISDTLHVPIRFIGVGEGIDDLRRFDADDFAAALLDLEA